MPHGADIPTFKKERAHWFQIAGKMVLQPISKLPFLSMPAKKFPAGTFCTRNGSHRQLLKTLHCMSCSMANANAMQLSATSMSLGHIKKLKVYVDICVMVTGLLGRNPTLETTGAAALRSPLSASTAMQSSPTTIAI